MAPDPTVAPPRWKGLRMEANVRKLMIREVVQHLAGDRGLPGPVHFP